MTSRSFINPFKGMKLPGGDAAPDMSASLERYTDDSFDQSAEGVADTIIVTLENLLDQHRFREFSNGIEYQEALEPITGRYTGSDAPFQSELKHPGTSIRLSGTSYAVIYGGVGMCFGEGLTKEGGTAWIKIDTHFHSQHPSLRLTVGDPEGKEADVLFYIFPHTLRRDDEGYVHFKIYSNLEAGLGGSDDLQQHTEIQDRKKHNSLMEIKLELWSLNTLDPGSVEEDRQYVSEGVEQGRPTFTGISSNELERIVNLVNDVGPNETTQRQQLLAMLATRTHLRIFRAWPDGGAKQLDTYRDWLECAFMACAFWGYEWYYRLQMDQELDSVDIDYSTLNQPRWTATEFKITKNTKGEVLSAKPHKVQPFVPKNSATKGSLMLPMIAIRVFELCVAVDRNQSHQSAVLRNFMRDNEFKIKGSLMKHPDVEGRYVVGLHPTSHGRVLTADRSIKPEPKTRVRMFIKASSDGAQNYHRFHGIVIEDLFGTRAELTLLVEGPELDFDYRIPPSGFEKNEYLVAVECVDDPTPSLRWKSSIHELNRGQQYRTKGLDVKHLVLQSPPTMTDTGSMANEMAANSACNDLVRVIAMERKLGAMQTKAVEVACTTKSGLATIQGPPGTGKSETLAAIGEVQHAVGNAIGVRRCGLGVASSNFAVGELAKKFINTKHRKANMEIVIYRVPRWATKRSTRSARSSNRLS
jgi:hypothetical protein